MSLWFVAGMLAAVNPCGFILLPTYLMYFLGLQGNAPGSQRATLRKALWVSASVSAGFVAVFLVVATISQYFTTWIEGNAKYATGFFGVALIALGISMLFGYKLPFTTPQIEGGGKDQTFASMFVYGVAYAVASIGCTIGFFISALFATSRRSGVLTGVQNGIAYAAGMALLVGGLTIGLAFANTGLLKVLRRGLQFIDRIAAAFVLLSGIYLIWYFYWVDLREEGDPVTDWVTFRQAEISTYLNDHRWGVAVTLFALLGATIAYVYARRWTWLAAAIVVGAPIGVLLAGDWRPVAVVTAAVAAAGALGVAGADKEPTVADTTEPPTTRPPALSTDSV